MTKNLLRPILPADLPIIFEQQLDPEAAALAGYPSKDRGEFMRHWEGILRNRTAIARCIVYKGRIAGHLLCWREKHEQRIGYWLGREFRGRGIAGAALAEFLKEVVKTRPLYAHAASHNIASKRVLEKNGFEALDETEKLAVFRLE